MTLFVRQIIVEIYRFKLTRDRDICQSLPQATYGHVGFSFNQGKKIYGFGPDAPRLTLEELNRTLRGRESFPGRLSDDTNIFKTAKELGLNVQREQYSLSFWRYWNARIQAKIDEIRSPLNNKRYMLPPRQGDFPPNCYNCATYPTSIGLPTSTPSGRLSDNP